MENKLPTAEKYIKKHPYVDSFLGSAQGYEVLINFMVEFAKLHVTAALKQASDQATAIGGGYQSDSRHLPSNKTTVNKESILNSYPLENIV